MAYIPRKVVKGKHYAVYSESGKKRVKTKAALLKEALKLAIKEDQHVEWIDFIPARFTLQCHGWFPPGTFKNLKEVKDFINASLKKGGDPVKDIEKQKGGKFHYDLRIQKVTAPTWFGICFDEQTEILTETRGWQKFSALQKGEKVAVLGKDWSIDFRAPRAIIKRTWDGTMISVKNQNIDMLITPEHKVYFKKDKNFKLYPAIEVYQQRGVFSRKINLRAVKQKFAGNSALLNLIKPQGKNFISVSKKDWTLTDYRGYVWDVAIEGDAVCLVRRNGLYHWSGRTPFRAPWTGTPENKVMTSVKGYTSIVPGGKKLQEFLRERAEKEMAAEGIAERRDRLEWMRVKAQWFPINSPGNPQKNQPAVMVAIEYYKPAVLHRRSLDFIDCTFLGDYLRGRYYCRLVERKLSEDEMTKWQKEAIKQGRAKAFYGLAFYFWKAKDQFDLKEMLAIALGRKTKDRIPAPKPKE